MSFHWHQSSSSIFFSSFGKVKLKTYFHDLSSLNFPEWYLNQPVAGDGVDPWEVVLSVMVEMSFRLAWDQVVVSAVQQAKTAAVVAAVTAEEVEVVAVERVAIGLVVLSVASTYPREHSNQLGKS